MRATLKNIYNNIYNSENKPAAYTSSAIGAGQNSVFHLQQKSRLQLRGDRLRIVDILFARLLYLSLIN
jgi:hypothetical protein